MERTMTDNPNRHHAYGPPIVAVVPPPIIPIPAAPVIRCAACHDIWTHGHEHRCPHGGQPPPGVAHAAPPPPWKPPVPQFQGDTKFEQEALEEARREWQGMTDDQMRAARGVHTVVRHVEGGFHLETVPLAVLVPTAAQVRAAGAAATLEKRDAARAAKERGEKPKE
jgi:hypothetical protein